MVSKREQDHKFCDFGTGSSVEMSANFEQGWIKWRLNDKLEVRLGEKDVGSLFLGDVEWVPFIAMYDRLDSVEWSISKE